MAMRQDNLGDPLAAAQYRAFQQRSGQRIANAAVALHSVLVRDRDNRRSRDRHSRRASNESNDSSPGVRVPVVGFILDGDVPIRERGSGIQTRTSLPKELTSLSTHLKKASARGEADPELVHALEALQEAFVHIAFMLRSGVRTPAGWDASLDAGAAEYGTLSYGLHGRLSTTREAIRARSDGAAWQREVVRLDDRVATVLMESLRGTRACAVALYTHEGIVELEVDEEDEGDGESGDGSEASESSTDLLQRMGLGVEQPNSGSSTDLTPPLTPSGSSSDLLEKHGLAAAGKAPSTDLLEKMGLAAAPPPPPADPYDYYTASCDDYYGGGQNSDPPPAAAAAPKKPSRTKLAVVLDPLNGSSLADAGVAVGTIFSIYRADGRDDDERGPPSSHVLRPGSELLAAGYALFGAASQVVLSHGHGVDGFTMHPVLETFMLTRPRILLPSVGRFYSVNMGHRRFWSPIVADHIDKCAVTKSLRYIGTFIADVHRTLLYGGVFFYPPNRKRPMGKLRLLYEATPIAFLMEQAGGGCTTGTQRLLDVQPMSLQQVTPIAFGSLADVEGYKRSCSAIERPQGLLGLGWEPPPGWEAKSGGGGGGGGGGGAEGEGSPTGRRDARGGFSPARLRNSASAPSNLSGAAGSAPSPPPSAPSSSEQGTPPEIKYQPPADFGGESQFDYYESRY